MARPKQPYQIAIQPKTIACWRLWFKEPHGFWTNGGICLTRRDAQTAIAALEARGYECKTEYLGRYPDTAK